MSDKWGKFLRVVTDVAVLFAIPIGVYFASLRRLAPSWIIQAAAFGVMVFTIAFLTNTFRQPSEGGRAQTQPFRSIF
ncbi:MAG: hypothetical protein ABIR63_01725 [Sphingomicrobium sp.]